MEELIKRLRSAIYSVTAKEAIEAADALERQEAELATLRQQIAEPCGEIKTHKDYGNLIIWREWFQPAAGMLIYTTPQPCPKCAKAVEALKLAKEHMPRDKWDALFFDGCIAELEK